MGPRFVADLLARVVRRPQPEIRRLIRRYQSLFRASGPESVEPVR